MTTKQKVAWEVFMITGQGATMPYFFGSNRNHYRRKILECIIGAKIPAAKCGYHALRNALIEIFEIKPDTIAGQDFAIQTAILEHVGEISHA